MCKQSLCVTQYSKNSSKKDGLSSHCKRCHSEYRKNRYKDNPEKEKAINLKYRNKNTVNTKCSCCDKVLRRYRTNVGEGKNNFCNSSCMTKFYKKEENVFKSYIRKSRRRASTIKKPFNLTEEFLRELLKKQNRKCALTGVSIELISRDRKGTLSNTASIDRIDSSKGYIKGNVRFVCLGINYMKNRRDDSEVLELLNLIKTSII